MSTSTEQKPQCIGFIMDGNRRWAKNQGLTTLEGHSKGAEVLKAMITKTHSIGIPHMVCYAFSTENWNRAEKEVHYLMDLMRSAIKDIRQEIEKNGRNINIHIIGETERLPEDLRAEVIRIESEHHTHPELTVWIAISYGGRADIVQAVNNAIKKGEVVTEETFAPALWTRGMPDPDLIIRTSGEYRLSNFLLWEAAYSELFFTDTLWPDYGESELEGMLEQYANRKRRKGV